MATTRGYYQTGGTLAGVNAAAAVTAGQATAGLTALTGVGAKTIVFTGGDVGQLPEAALYGGQAAVGSAYSAAYNSLMQASLAKLAAQGVRVEYVDNTVVLKSIIANQSQTSIKFLTACPFSCIGNPALQSQYLFYFDGIHLTSAGFAILGEFVVNRLQAPLTFAAQGQTGVATTAGFVSTMFGRTELAGGGGGATAVTPGGPSYLGASPDGGPRYAPGPAHMQAYILAKGGADNSGATTINPAYSTTSEGGTVGLEYKFNRTSMVGTAFDFTNATSRLNGMSAKSAVDAYQFGVYGAWNPSNFFAEGLASIGTQHVNNTRAGVFAGDISSSAGGTSAAAAGKLGYLFNTGSLRFGPIVGLTYASSTTDGYTENGDPALTLTVGKQTVEALVGSAGIQLRYPVAFGGQTLMPYLNLTAEEDFKGNGRSIQYSATSAPLIVNTFAIDGGQKYVYGRIAGGVSADINSMLAVNLNVNETFGHGTNGFDLVGGLAYKF